MKKIVFTGGGTLGHVMPNTYLMEELKDYKIAYIAGDGIEKELLENKVDYHTIPVVKLVRGRFFVNLKIPFVLISAIRKSKKILKEFKPDVIFSKGGYVSLPVCLAARKLRIPIIAHESDYSFGLANKIILKLCDVMCVNFKNLESVNKKVIYTGPIFSRQFESKKINKTNLNLHPNKKNILIVGGSLGSKIINDNIYPILKDLLKEFNIIHIVGKGNIKIKSYDNYNAIELTKDMNSLYNLADFVIGRSGAGVSAECFYKRLPMILIPLENKSSRGDQLQNAKYYKNLGVATILREHELTPTKLFNEIKAFKNWLENYLKNYQKFNTANGLDKVLKIIKKY